MKYIVNYILKDGTIFTGTAENKVPPLNCEVKYPVIGQEPTVVKYKLKKTVIKGPACCIESVTYEEI